MIWACKDITSNTTLIRAIKINLDCFSGIINVVIMPNEIDRIYKIAKKPWNWGEKFLDV